MVLASFRVILKSWNGSWAEQGCYGNEPGAEQGYSGNEPAWGWTCYLVCNIEKLSCDEVIQ